MIFRPSTLLWMMLWVFAAFGLYMVKYKVQAIKAQVAMAEKQLNDEKKNLHVLTAEWTYLNRPERLRQLSAHYLDIKPLHGKQLADFASLPGAKPGYGVEQASDDEEGIEVENPVTLASGATHGE